MDSYYIWQFFSYFGDIAYWLGFTISFLLIYPFLYERDKKKFNWILYFLIPSVLFSYVSSFFLREYFKIPRMCAGMEYCPQTYAFPSGHATIAASLFTTVYLIFGKNHKIQLLVFLLSFLVCYSRIALGVHTVFDILGGILVGILISIIWYKFYKRILEIKKNNFIMRKLIHIGAVAILPLYLQVKHSYLLISLTTISLVYLFSEIFRLKNIYLPILHDITLKCKKREEKGLVYSPLLFSVSLILLMSFGKEVFLAGSIALIIGDGFAGLVGYKFGKNKLPHNPNKSIEGTVSFFLSTFLAYLLFFSFQKSLILALFGALLESFLRKEENLVLPLSVGIISTFF